MGPELNPVSWAGLGSPAYSSQGLMEKKVLNAGDLGLSNAY